jgi:tetratricopeptide (TPR) repeat protein
MAAGLLVFTSFLLADTPSLKKTEPSADAAVRQKLLQLNDITGAIPMAETIETLAKTTDVKKIVAAGVLMLKETPMPLNRNSTLMLALLADDVKEIDASAAFFRVTAKQATKLGSERAMAQAYIGLIEMYQRHKRFADSEKACKEVLAIESTEEDSPIENIKPLVQRRLILAIAKTGGIDKAVRMIDELIKEDPRNWLHKVLKAQVLREAERYEAAAKVYLEVIEQVSKDRRVAKEDREEMIEEYRYMLSNLYIELNDVNKAAEQLKLLLAKDPNNPTWNNDLGYIWADRGMNLVESEKLIRKALAEDRKQKTELMAKAKEKGITLPDLDPEKDSAAYLDSLGWVLFKQGKHKEAKKALLDAVKEKEGQNIEILDHLADIHMALDEKAEAIAVWKKALETAGRTKRDERRRIEVEKKLKAAEGK